MKDITDTTNEELKMTDYKQLSKELYETLWQVRHMCLSMEQHYKKTVEYYEAPTTRSTETMTDEDE